MKKITLLVVASIVFVKPVFSCDSNHLNYIKHNFGQAYKDYNKFFKTLECYEKQAIAGDKKAILEIVNLYGVGVNNSEFSVWYAETIKSIFLSSPTSLFDVLLIKDEKRQDAIIHYLERPIDGETEKIQIIAKDLHKQKKYKKMAKKLIY